MIAQHVFSQNMQLGTVSRQRKGTRVISEIRDMDDIRYVYSNSQVRVCPVIKHLNSKTIRGLIGYSLLSLPVKPHANTPLRVVPNRDMGFPFVCLALS
jgi:hypothetical protein